VARSTNYTARFQNLSQRVTRGVEKAIQEASRGVLESVAHGTPADTSRAISNWTVTLGSPSSAYREPYIPGVKGSTKSLNAETTIRAGLPTIMSARLTDVVYIVNNAPYIIELEYGKSSQAPSGFVQQALVAGVTRVRAAKVF